MCPTSSPSGYKSDILDLDDVESKPVTFKAILHPNFSHPSSQIVKNFSQDQQILLGLCHAIIKGEMDQRLANRKIGVVSHSRPGFLPLPLLFNNLVAITRYTLILPIFVLFGPI